MWEKFGVVGDFDILLQIFCLQMHSTRHQKPGVLCVYVMKFVSSVYYQCDVTVYIVSFIFHGESGG